MSIVVGHSCKTAASKKPDSSALMGSRNSDDVCCAQTTDKGTFYNTRACSERTLSGAIQCCKRNALGWTTQASMQAYPFACDAVPDSYLSDVSVCRGPTRFRQGNRIVGGLSDTASSLVNARHVWIKTYSKEVGMGPKQWDALDRPTNAAEELAYLFDAVRLDKRISVAWRDHEGYSNVEGSECSRLYFCDETCVNRETPFGASLNYYTLLNQCHSATTKILRHCGCFDHCVAWSGNVCVKRVFPELKAFNLSEDAE